MHNFESHLTLKSPNSFDSCCSRSLPAKQTLKTSGISKYIFDIDIFLRSTHGRKEAEQFISNGFKKEYNANISITMPWILAINNGSFKAALGIRSAIHPLFLEQYLDSSIENTIALHLSSCSRKQVAEIGHLYSNAKKFTLPLFLTTAVSLFYNRFEYMVFSATEHVLKLISSTGITCHTIAEADPSKLQECSDNWGSYYTTCPQVVVLQLTEVMRLINRNAGYSSMFNMLSDRIANASLKIQGEHNV